MECHTTGKDRLPSGPWGTSQSVPGPKGKGDRRAQARSPVLCGPLGQLFLENFLQGLAWAAPQSAFSGRSLLRGRVTLAETCLLGAGLQELWLWEDG